MSRKKALAAAKMSATPIVNTNWTAAMIGIVRIHRLSRLG